MKRPDSRPSIKRHEMLTELVEVAMKTLVGYDIPPDVADAAANTIADHVADHWGGQVTTWPKDFLWKLSQRELAIYQDWQQHGRGDLAAHARKYRFTESGMRKLLKRIQSKIEAQRHEAQLDLVEETEDGDAEK